MNGEILCVGDLIYELSKYPSDRKVFYTTRYALAKLDIKLLDSYVVVDMTDECKEVLKFE